MSNHYITTNAVQQDSWAQNYVFKLKVVREKLYSILNEPYQESFDVTDNLCRLASSVEGIELALEYARLEADLLKKFEKEVVKAPSSNRKVVKDLCKDFKVESLPTAMRKYIEDICKTTEAHPMMVASSVLTMLSGFIGTKVYIPEGVYYQNLYPNLWMLNITKSGSYKSSALSKGSKIAYDYSNKVSEVVHKYYDEIKREIDPVKKHDLFKRMTEVSVRNPVLPNKVTPEALLDLLARGHGGTIMSNEFGGWLAALENSQNGDLKALFTELYDGYPYRYYTKTQGDCFIKKPCFSINGVSNLPWVREKIKPSDVESGFFARFLLYTPQFSTETPEGLPELDNDENDVFMDESGLKKFLSALKKRHDVEGDIKMRIELDARKYFLDCHKEMYHMIWDDMPHLKETLTPYLKRWSPSFLKVATIMQMVENPGSTHIGMAAMKAARSIIWPAILSTIDLFENHIGRSEYQHKCLKIRKFIEEKYVVTEKPVSRQVILSSGLLDFGYKEYDDVLTTLVEEGKIELIPGKIMGLNAYIPLMVTIPPKDKEPNAMPPEEEYSAEAIERDYKLLSSIKKLDISEGVQNGRSINERLQSSSEQSIYITGQAGGTPKTETGGTWSVRSPEGGQNQDWT